MNNVYGFRNIMCKKEENTKAEAFASAFVFIENYLCPKLAFTKLTNKGCGFSTVLLYSG